MWQLYYLKTTGEFVVTHGNLAALMMTEGCEAFEAFTRTTAVYPQDKAAEYLLFGLASELGELSGVAKKAIRGDYGPEEERRRLGSELGDVFWYLARMIDEGASSHLVWPVLCFNDDSRLVAYGEPFDIGEIFEAVTAKLSKRKADGTIRGDGEERAAAQGDGIP